jgi:NhaP-type Na+/H+ or K+/H+ antiporter
MIPWSSFVSRSTGVLQGHIGVGSLTLFLVLVLLFRRIPIVLALQAGKLIPDVKTYREALFCGHFGPMGVGALFLAIETRAQLETGTSIPLPRPKPPVGPPYDDSDVAKALVWPVICFVVLGSSMVHGLSGLVISLGGHLSRRQGERAPLLGGESEGLAGMVHEGSGAEEDEVGNGDSVH